MLLLLFCNRNFHCFHIKIGLQSPHDFGSIKWRNASLFWHPVNRKAKGLSSTRVTISKRWKIASNVTFFQSWKRYTLCCDTFIKSYNIYPRDPKTWPLLMGVCLSFILWTMEVLATVRLSKAQVWLYCVSLHILIHIKIATLLFTPCLILRCFSEHKW